MDDQDQGRVTDGRAKRGKLGRILAAAAVVLLLAGVWLVVYLLVIKDDTAAPEVVNQAKQSATTPDDDDEDEEPVRHTSKLWPDLVFDVPKGWQVEEPEAYDNTNGAEFVDGDIVLRGDDVTFTLTLKTILATGFEAYQCYEKDRLVHIAGQTYRFVEGDKVVFEAGYSESDDEWSGLIAGESASYQVGHNFCQLSPFIGTYTSNVRQAEHPDASYGYASEENALVWLSAVGEGDIDSAKIQALDTIVASLSSGADVR